MIELSVLLTFIPLCFAMSLIPGPDTMFVLSMSLSGGRWAGIATSVGICFGLYLYALLAGLGLAAILTYSPLMFEVLKLAGAGYLVLLAWKSLRSHDDPYDTTQIAPRTTHTKYFVRGLMNDLANPKAALFFSAVFPQFLHPSDGNVVIQALLLATVSNLISLAVFSIVAIASAYIANVLRQSATLRRTMRWMVTTIFLGLAIRLAFVRAER